MKMESINNEEGRHYVTTWIKILHVFLGWPEEKAMKWAEPRLAHLNDPHSLLFIEPPTWYILHLLLPESLRALTGPDRQMLARFLLLAIGKKDTLCDARPAFDWKLAKRRAKTFLDKAQAEHRKGNLRPFLERCQRRNLDPEAEGGIATLMRKVMAEAKRDKNRSARRKE